MDSASGLEIINPAVLAHAEQHRNEFTAASPFPHIVIEDFLDNTFAQSLFDAFPSFERGNFIGDDGEPGGKSTLAKIRQCGPAVDADLKLTRRADSKLTRDEDGHTRWPSVDNGTVYWAG
ncbi:hypothetical protein [Rhodanobacter terrae]|uniref:Uncharacterized protein n=1 Tax=Rhodanobacter terrae TaxID=418647 RepID=A0ABW0T2G7_9GAMM